MGEVEVLVRDYARQCPPITVTELERHLELVVAGDTKATTAEFSQRTREPASASDSSAAESDEQGEDDLIDYVPRPDGSTPPGESTRPTTRKRTIGVITAVATAILLVVGAVVVVADRDGGDVATDAASSPSVAGPGPTLGGENNAAENTGTEAAPRDKDWQRMSSVIAAGPGLVAVGRSSTGNPSVVWSDAAVWTSVDGTTWSQAPHDPAVFDQAHSDAMSSVTVGGPGFVAVGSKIESEDFEEPGISAVVWTSVDGITWSRVPHDEAVFGGPGNKAMNSVTAGGPGLVAIGVDGDNAGVWTSVDGFTWSRAPEDEAVLGGAGMVGVAAGGPGLVAVGASYGDDFAAETEEEDGEDAAVWTSVDGVAWSRVPHDEAVFGGPGNQEMVEVIVGGPGLVAIGADEGDAAVWTSVDGFTWSRVPHDEAVFGGPKEQWMDSVTVGGPGLVAVGSEGQDDESDHSEDFDAAVWTSVDGLVWSRVAAGRGALGVAGGQNMSSVTTTDLGLVAVGHDWTYTGARDQVDRVDAAVWTSPDGTNWSRVEFEQS